MNIVFFNNNLIGFVLFRFEVIKKFLDRGDNVYVIAPEGEPEDVIRRLPSGSKYIPIKMNRTSTNPLKDMSVFLSVLNILKAIKPCYLFNYTIKPNIYGALAAKFLGISCTNMIAGLGYIFTNNNLSSMIGRTLYGLAGKCAERIVVLNQSNYDVVLSKGICRKEKLHLLAGGEGVDLNRYPYYPNDAFVHKFVFIGRLIEEKGYYEFVEAASQIQKSYKNVEFHVVGGFDKDYPRRVVKEQVERDVLDRGIVYDGSIDDMSKVYSQKGVIIVIPSYYSEGLNRSLMEGCASGKPIITTDWPGCRETVRDGVNGFLVEPRNVESLTLAIEKYIKLDEEEKCRFSIASRQLAEQKFNIESVVSYYESLADASLKDERNMS